MRWRALLFVAGFSTYAGVLWEPAWSTVNDGDNLTWAMEARQKFLDGHVSLETFNASFAAAGRFSPGYLIFRSIEYQFFGLDCWKHHLAHVLAMLGAAQLLYGIALRATGSAGAGFLAAFAFTFCGTNVDNWCRLDMGEFYVTCLGVLAFWLFVLALSQPLERRAFRWVCTASSLTAIWLAFLTKETAPALISVAGAAWAASLLGTGDLLSKRNRGLCGMYFAAQALLVLLLAWFRKTSSTAPIAKGFYTSAYEIRPDVMLATAVKYADVIWNAFQLLTLIAFAFWVWHLFLWIRRKRELDACDGWAFVGLAWFGTFLAGLLPWKAPLARYLGAAMPGLALFIAAMVSRYLHNNKPHPDSRKPFWTTVIRGLLVVNLAFLPVSTVVRAYNYTVFRHDYDHATHAVMEMLASHAPVGARLYMNCPPDFSGCFREMQPLLRLLFDRRDLELHYLHRPGRLEPRPGDYLLTFTREGSPRNIEVTLPASFHAQTLPRLADRLTLLSNFRHDRHLLNVYPDAPFFTIAARLGVKLPDYVGMQTGHQRLFFACERSLVEWRVYRFER